MFLRGYRFPKMARNVWLHEKVSVNEKSRLQQNEAVIRHVLTYYPAHETGRRCYWCEPWVGAHLLQYTQRHGRCRCSMKMEFLCICGVWYTASSAAPPPPPAAAAGAAVVMLQLDGRRRRYALQSTVSPGRRGDISTTANSWTRGRYCGWAVSSPVNRLLVPGSAYRRQRHRTTTHTHTHTLTQAQSHGKCTT